MTGTARHRTERNENLAEVVREHGPARADMIGDDHPQGPDIVPGGGGFGEWPTDVDGSDYP